MADSDWFRRTTWSERDSQEFFERLARSRSQFHKAQYLRVQAVTLEQAGRAELARAALQLIELIFNEYPERSEFTIALWTKCRALLTLGQTLAALESFVEAVKWERQLLGYYTDAHLDFAWTVATMGMNHHFDEAIELLDEYADGHHFPVQRFRSAAAGAFIHHARGDQGLSIELVRVALEEKVQDHSGFRYHPKLGLVNGIDPLIIEKLESMVNA